MIIGDRLRELRRQKKLSQAQIENRPGLQRAYLSRVENGHTVPTIGTLEKWATALEVPIYLLFYDGAEPPKSSELHVWKSPDETAGAPPARTWNISSNFVATSANSTSQSATHSTDDVETGSPRAKIRRRGEVSQRRPAFFSSAQKRRRTIGKKARRVPSGTD
jgi:transcriptional regulator with XRE-family HTH domain